MKTFLLAAFALLTASAAAAQKPIRGAVAVNPDAAVRILSLAGVIRVTGWDRDSVVVTGVIQGDPRAFYLGGGGGGAKLGVEARTPEAVVVAELDVRVPHRARLWVKTESAAITISGVNRVIDAYAVTGSIVIREAARQTYAEAMDGPIEVTGDVTWLRLKSADGPIVFRGSADDATMSSVSGTVRIHGERIGRGRFETITGDIFYRGPIDRAGSYTFESHSGAVELALPARVDADLDVSTLQGTIRNELSSAVPRSGRGDRGQELSATLGAGGGQITVRTFKGNIQLKP